MIPVLVMVSILAAVIFAIVVRRAPEGYEDDAGFHYGPRREPDPRQVEEIRRQLHPEAYPEVWR